MNVEKWTLQEINKIKELEVWEVTSVLEMPLHPMLRWLSLPTFA